jgi:CheY-like chemotaxis protein
VPRVLVVDDDEDIRDLIALRLRRQGYDVSVIGDPLEALSFAAAHAYDLAILDWTMPEMDGGELCARLRQHPRSGDAPILVVTAHADPQTRESAFAAGASDYLAKPFTLQRLTEVVASLIATTARGGSVAETPSEPGGST